MSGGLPDPHAKTPADGPWGSLLPEESGLVAFWPEREPPQLAEVVESIRAWLGVEKRNAEGVQDAGADTLDEPDSDDEREDADDDEADAEAGDEDPIDAGDGIHARAVEMDPGGALWGLQLNIPSLRAGLILWVEEAAPLGESEREMLGTEASDSLWVLRVQTVLGATTAASDYFMVLNLVAGSMPELVGILDVVTSQYFPRKRLAQLFLAPDTAPIDHALWRLGRFDSSDGATTLLATTGLRRCGLPELELLGLPVEHAQSGVVLLQTLASLLLEGEMPTPGTTLEIGDQLAVSLRRSTLVSATLPELALGSVAWRTHMESVGMDRFQEESAVVGPAQGEARSKDELFPVRVIEVIANGEAVLYVSTNEATADLRRAQATFATFATAFASLHRRDHPEWTDLAERAFLVQASIEDDPTLGGPALRADAVTEPDDRIEQVWLEVRAIEKAGIRGALAASPRSRPELRIGMEVTVPAWRVTNWRVEFPTRSYGPAEADDLLVEVDRVRGLARSEGTSP
ncbi:MAG: DUF2314 domain-containing protein [Planctomycetota bacterium]|nr:DUF2314 domain-containing protein [Planctomycetota bacterium]